MTVTEKQSKSSFWTEKQQLRWLMVFGLKNKKKMKAGPHNSREMAVAPNNYDVYGKRIAEEAFSKTAVAYNKYDVSGNRIAEAPPVAAATFLGFPESPERRPAIAVTNQKLVNAPEDPKMEVSCTDSNHPFPPPMGPQPHPPPQELMSQQQEQEQEQQQQEIFLLPRSSCSLPAIAAVSMAAMIEQKLVNAGCYEPFVLTRCKSEPMRTATVKLMSEACFWKNRKLG